MLLRLLFFTLFFTAMNVFPQSAPIETGVSQTLARWRAANYSNVRYKLNITLKRGAPLMRGEIEIHVTLTDEGAKNDLILDWRTTQFANDKDKPFADVVAVNEQSMKDSKDGSVFDYQTNKEHLIVSKKFLKAGENVLKINFASPIKTSGAAITRYVDKEDGAEYVYSLFVPSDASTAFPCFDQPDLKARFQLNVNIGGGRQRPFWKVISNTEVENSFDTTWNNFYAFKETQPISTYVFAFAAGEFAEFSKSAIVTGNLNVSDSALDNEPTPKTKIYVRKSQIEKFKQHSAEVFRLNREGIKFLESWFEYKFPFPKYDLVLIPEFPFGGMEHAGATFLREDRVIFPTEPTKNDYITRANVIFHEAAHQWFGDTVTMRWFDDLWLKEGFAEFMAYKTLEKVMPEYNAWKIFYERNKQAAYLTDATRGTTPIYQEIPNLSAAKSAYGNIVYRKAPSFLRQAEFYLGEDKFQTAVRAFLKKHEFANATWQDLVNEFVEVKSAELKSQEYYQKLSPEEKREAEAGRKNQINEWANVWVKHPGMPLIRVSPDFLPLPYETKDMVNMGETGGGAFWLTYFWQRPAGSEIGSEEAVNSQGNNWKQNAKVLRVFGDGTREEATVNLGFTFFDLSKLKFSKKDEYKFTVSEEERKKFAEEFEAKRKERLKKNPLYVFPNYQDYGYGIFLLDEKSRTYVFANIQTEKDDFLRAMMWGALWDSVREGELNPKDYVELVVKNIKVEQDESTIQTLLGRVSTAMNYYLADKERETLAVRLEAVLIGRMRDAKTIGQKITFFRSYLNIASTDNSQRLLKKILKSGGKPVGLETLGSIIGKVPTIEVPPLKTKDKFDIVTKLLILENKKIIGSDEAEKLIAELEKSETGDEAKRYAYAARAGIGTAENKAKFWTDFVNNKELSESWIESAFAAFNSPRHSDLTLPYLEKALAELPKLKRNRKIFFVNGWLAAFIGGQGNEQALAIVNKFLADNPNLDKDLRLKILENADNLERAVKIRNKFKVD